MRSAQKGKNMRYPELILNDTTNGTSMKINEEIALTLLKSYPGDANAKLDELYNGHCYSVPGGIVSCRETDTSA